MPRCPNCFRETMRTKDWACYLCGYPLSSPVFKLIDKTYGEIRQDRLNAKKQPVHVDEQIYEDLDQEKEIIREMQHVPLVNEIDIHEKYDANQSYNTIGEEQISEEPEFKEEIAECLTVTDESEEETAIEEDILPKSADDEPEEIVTPECNCKADETVAEDPDIPEESDDITEEPEKVDAEIETVSEVPVVFETNNNKVEEAAAIELIEEQEIKQVQVKTETVAPADIDITIDDLLADYTADYISATNKYVNKRLRLSGYAAAIDVKEVLAIHYIRLTDASLNAMKSVQCMFDKKYADDLRKLEKGQQVTIQGKYTGSLIAMRMTDCIII